MSVSNASKSSKAGTSNSVSSARLKAAATLARLKAEASHMAAMRAIEEEEFRLQQRKRDCKLQLEIAKAEAEEKVLEDIDEQSSQEDQPELNLVRSTAATKVDQWLTGTPQPSVPVQSPSPVATMPLQREMIDTLLLPKCELVKFNGDPLDYWIFISSFDGAVGSTSVGACAKLNCLFQYCEGEALAVIRCCAVMRPEEGYTKARELLRERFGNDYRISETWVRKLTEGPRILPGEHKGIQRLADDLQSCTLALSAMNKLDEIDTKRSLSLIVKRLPNYQQGKWRSKAVSILDKTGRYPNIAELVKFLSKAAREANDPVYGLEDRITKEKSTMKKGANYNVQATSKFDQRSRVGTDIPKGRGGKNELMKQTACPLCSEGHMLTACDNFRKMSPTDRVKVASENRLCFNCLSGGRHFSRNCKEAPCSVQGCKGKHSKMLHGAFQGASSRNDIVPRGESSDDQKVGATSLACGSTQEHSKVALPVVAVMVKGTGSGEWLKTHALLDPGSNGSFCSMELVKMLSVQGTSQSLSLDTLNTNSQVQTLVVSLDISGTIGKAHARKSFCIPKIHALREFPTLRDSCATHEDLKKFEHLRDIPVPCVAKEGVTILIGQDAPQVLVPLEVRRGMEGEPYAVRTCLGWTVNGPLADGIPAAAVSSFVQGGLESQVERFWKLDTTDLSDDRTMSLDDKKAVKTWNDSIILVDGHYQLDIPFKSIPPNLPENKIVAERRLQSLAKRLTKDPGLHSRYCAEMQHLLSRGFSERVPEQELESSPGQTWYLPHHCVLNPNKPEKLRIVFDCAARCCDTSLNDRVLQGPDMMNKLVGILTRFREHKVGLMGDIEQMFHQVGVSKKHRDVLRFLWWPEGDVTRPPEVFRMTVHLFGGVWSPSCAAFALRRTADDNEATFSSDAVMAVKENFYVDDLLKSFKSEDDAALMVKQLTHLLAKGGFHLTKWICSSRKVMYSIPMAERAKTVTGLDLDHERLPVERALGVCWDTEGDQIGVKIKTRRGCHTKRGLLSILSSVYDPLGFVCPFVLRAKILFQNECRIVGKGWDEPLEVSTQDRWARWLDDLPRLDQFAVDRCLVPGDFGIISECRLHHFSDASQDAYGTVSYARFVNTDGDVYCTFLIGKTRLAPLKTITIPRLELSAAVVAVRMDQMLRRELRLQVQGSTFWTDSMLVLQYVGNQSKRFQTFVANRVATIHDGSTANQWRYVNSEQNPADDASRGLDALSMLDKKRWRKGPDFLWQSEDNWPVTPKVPSLQEKDKEVRKEALSRAIDAVDQDNPVDRLISRYSSLYRLRKAVAWILRFMKWLQQHRPGNLVVGDKGYQKLTVGELQDAELAIIRSVQRRHYKEEFHDLLAGKASVKRQSSVYSLEPYVDDNGVLRLGGRLRLAPVEPTRKYPAILPRDSHLATLMVRRAHELLSGHSGKEYVLSLIRRQYWIPKVRPLINRILRECVLCRRLRGSSGVQRMADLPAYRVTPGKPPFTDVGVDCFGPFHVKRGRSREKRYGCIFTCMSIRAVHLEKLHSLDTDSFLNAFLRFAARRGTPKTVHSDNGTNFVGGEKELRAAIKRLEESKQTEGFFLNRRIEWQFNPPAASHMGGVWERHIRTCRKVLGSLLRDQVLDDERLDTLLCEVESIVNDRPITAVSDDPTDLEPLTPNHLLKLGHGHPVPLRDLKATDQYGKRWKHVQFLVEQFWRRWTAEYLPTLQRRQRWIQRQPNFKADDL